MLQPGLASGTYTIDPDGSGADPAFSVACDMSTDGGGWTIVFLPTTSDLQATPIDYTSSTPRLFADAQSALLAYRDAAGVAVSAHATFDLPSDWRTDTPFDYAASDLATNVSIDGGTPALAMLRYGNQSFTTTCYDPWINTAGSFGRVCIIGTKAPFYNGFATAGADDCSDSMSPYAAVACSADFRFSIAVR